MWVYVKSEPQLWTVGFHDPRGQWWTDSDHTTQESAAERCAWLNGNGQTLNRGAEQLRARRSALEEQVDQELRQWSKGRF